MFKRIVSFSLVLLFVLSNFSFAKVFAAGVYFKIEDAYNLSEGSNNTIPSLGSSAFVDKNNTKTISWDFNQIDGTAANMAKYELSYYTADHIKLVLTVDKTDNNNAIVDFKFVHDTDPSYTANIGDTYRIYTNVGTTDTVKNYIKPADFITGMGDSSASAPLTTDHPSFKLIPNTGFSILYNNTVFHFLWDKNSGKFYLTSENFMQGTVYDLNLKYGISGLNSSNKLNLLTGISENTIHSIPTAIRKANLVNTPEQSFYIDGNLKYLFDTADLQINNGDNVPAVDPGFAFLFDLPKVFNPNTNCFEVFDGSQSLDFKVPIKITLDNEINPKIEISLSDIMKQTLTDINVDTSANCQLDKINNRLMITLTGLPAASIYHLSKIEVISEGSNLNKSTAQIDKPKVFTFIKYEPIYLNGKFYMQVYPYPGFEGNYLLKSGPNLNQSVSQYSNGKNPILFPLDNINLETASTGRYQIYFDPLKSFDNSGNITDIYSQIIQFKPDYSKITVGIVNDFEIKDDYSLYPDTSVEGNKKSDLSFNSLWDIGDTSLINKMLDLNNDKLELVYRLNKTTTIPSTDESVVSDIKMEITRVNNQIKVKYSGDGVLNTSEEILSSRYDIETDRTYYRADVKFSKDAFYKNSTLGQANDFKYPNIYFLNIRPINVNGNDVVVGPSLFESMTLNDITKSEISPPQNLTLYDIYTESKKDGGAKDEVSFKLKYEIPASIIKDYLLKYYKQPIDSANVDVNVNLYISSDENYLKNTFAKMPYDSRIAASKNVVYQENIIQDSDGTKISSVYFSDINGNTPLTAPGYSQPIDILRANQTARLGNITLTKAEIDAILNNSFTGTIPIKIDGLDKNQKYYVTSDLEIIYNNNGTENKKQSDLSNIVSALTIGDKEPVNEAEKIAPAPILQKKDIMLDRATIFWNRIKSTKSDLSEDIIEYEIIRLKDKQIDSASLESRIAFEKFWASLPDTEKLGFRTDKTKLFQFLNGGFSEADKEKFDYSETVDLINLIDKTLFPNNIYFYYARTVRIVDGERIYSSWSNISVTTNPVNPPINLRISTKDLAYDPRTEALIEFDAPITDLDKLGTEFFLEYSLKEDDGEFGAPIRMDIKSLKANAGKSTEEGYIHFLYKISGLNHGKNYTIRVRLVDKKGDASLYSNNASTRTNLDQEDYEDEKDKDDWTDYTQKEIEKELKNPYWTAANNNSLLELIFREDMFPGYMASFPDSIVQLPSGSAVDNIYYFPLKTIDMLNQANKGLRVNDGDMEVVISSGFLKDNEALNAALKGIKDKDFQDLYVKLSVSFKVRNELINNNPVLGKIAVVDLEIIGTNGLTKKLDDSIYSLLSEKIKSETESPKFKDKLDKIIKDDSKPEEIHKMVTEFINSQKSGFYKEITASLNKILKDKFRVVNLNSQVIIVQKNLDESSGIKGYYNESNTWQSVDVYEYNGGKGIYANRLGEYAFTGYKLYIVGLDSMQNAEKIKKLIVKYELLDYFGKDGFSTADGATKYAVTGALARISGAQRGDDVIKFLSAKGISVNKGNLYKGINIQDTLYLSMKIYEIKTKTKLESIKIKDYNSINKIAGIDSKNKLAINTAFETKVYTNKNFKPNDIITIGEFLKILLVLDI